MAAKAVLILCAQALLVQYISAQCVGAYPGMADGYAYGAGPYAGPLAYGGIAGAYAGAYDGIAGPYAGAYDGIAGPYAGAYGVLPAAANGGGFPVTSASPIAVTGVSMTSENVYEGPLAVSGAVPFLGAVALEGALPTAGAGAINYGSGSGNVAMLSEGVNALGAINGINGVNGINGFNGINGYGAYGYGPVGYDGIAAPGYGYGYGYNRGCGCGAL